MQAAMVFGQIYTSSS